MKTEIFADETGRLDIIRMPDEKEPVELSHRVKILHLTVSGWPRGPVYSETAMEWEKGK